MIPATHTDWKHKDGETHLVVHSSPRQVVTWGTKHSWFGTPAQFFMAFSANKQS